MGHRSARFGFRVRARLWLWWVLSVRPLFFPGRWCRFRWRRPVLVRPGFLAVWGVPLACAVVALLFVALVLFAVFAWGPG